MAEQVWLVCPQAINKVLALPRVGSRSLLCLVVLFINLLVPLQAIAGDIDESIGLSTEEIEWLAQHSRISVAYDGFFPPYSFLEADQSVSGFSVELFDLFEKKLGVTFTPYSRFQWKAL